MSEPQNQPSNPLEPHAKARQELSKHLDGVRDRLRQDFVARLDPETVEREFAVAAASFHDARVTTYVPVLVNRQVRLKLRELVGSR